ncbi:SLAM family member 5-like [Emydura macquarii macquarii]|uniref:SLAM family member 5-like n=1 Tax=Emydura macquarii macquarii TaxID=1129001 RepID=UPI003529D45C
MEGRLQPSFLFLLLLLQPGEYSRAEADESELTGTLGGSVTFPLRIPAPQKFKNGAWLVNTTKSLATIIAGTPPRVLVFAESYEGRLRVPDQTYSLQITSLRLEDSGTYSVEFNTDQESFAYREFMLRVQKQAPVTTIVCDSVTCGDGACNYTLRCMAGKRGGDVAYRWTQEERGAVVSMDPILRVSLRPFDPHSAVTCTARYPTSNSSRTVSPKDLCSVPTAKPSQASLLSYCRVVLLLALGALGAMA